MQINFALDLSVQHFGLVHLELLLELMEDLPHNNLASHYLVQIFPYRTVRLLVGHCLQECTKIHNFSLIYNFKLDIQYILRYCGSQSVIFNSEATKLHRKTSLNLIFSVCCKLMVIHVRFYVIFYH